MFLLLGHTIDQEIEWLMKELYYIETFVFGFCQNLSGNGTHVGGKAEWKMFSRLKDSIRLLSLRFWLFQRLPNIFGDLLV